MVELQIPGFHLCYHIRQGVAIHLAGDGKVSSKSPSILLYSELETDSLKIKPNPTKLPWDEEVGDWSRSGAHQDAKLDEAGAESVGFCLF